MGAMGAVDIASTGSGSQVQGDPVVALLAQLNRFAGKELLVGGSKAPRVYVRAAFPLATGNLTDAQATAAVMILIDRYQSAPLGTYSGSKASWAINGLANAIPFVTANLEEITTTIAEFGDSLGLSPAPVGITTKAEKFKPKFPYGTVAIVGGFFAVVAIMARRRT